MNPVMAANTGSVAKMRATRVGVVYFCTDVWMKKASAVAKMDVTIKAITTSGSNITSLLKMTCQSSKNKEPAHDRKATVKI